MPSITGQFLELTEAQFNELAPDGLPLHFRTFTTEIDPLTGIPQAQTARQTLAALAVTHGWPLRGIFISQAGGGRHFVLHRTEFPVQTGNPNDRAGKLTDAITAAFARVFHITTTVTDPTDPDFGETDEFDPFYANAHFWNHRTDGLYLPRVPGSGDYAIRIEDRTAGNTPANWWQRLT